MPASTILDIRSVSGDDDDDFEEQTWGEKLKKRAKIVLPHVGLVVLLVIYTTCGAGVFYWMERPRELKLRRDGVSELDARRQFIIDHFWNLTRSYDQNSSENKADFNAEMRMEMKQFEQWLIRMFDARHIIIEDVSDQERDVWTMSSAVFFASTVITTIGYGHMAPMTLGGRIFCIAFGLGGIPLLLITIADIGKFLSDLITMLYKSYRLFKIKLRRKSQKISYHWSQVAQQTNPGSSNPSSPSSHTAETDVNDMTIPVWIVLCFLSSYTALGGLLFQHLEGWTYFDSFYFCFITMATIGFGDLVPTEETYMFLTMVYIIIGLAVTTMCIDLAGTEYIRKIHYVGQKMENAKDLLNEGFHVSGDVFSKAGELINVKNIAFLRSRGLLTDDMQDDEFQNQLLKYLQSDPEQMRANILYETVSPKVRKLLGNVKIIPDEIQEGDAYILENKTYNHPVFPKVRRNPNIIYTRRQPTRDIMMESGHSESWPRRKHSPDRNSIMYIAPFILHESSV